MERNIFSGTFQDYLVFMPAEEYVKHFTVVLLLELGWVMKCQQKILKI